MNKKLLMEILAIPSKTYDESLMTEWLMSYFKNKPDCRCTRDTAGNVYVTKGQSSIYPCVCAHTDTVWHPQKTVIVEEGDKLFATDVSGKQVGCGGDDKAGIYICLQLLETMHALKAVFFVSEETGCHGSRKSDTEWFLDVGYILEFDSPCEDIISFTSNGTRLFPVEGPFFDTVFPVLKRNNVLKWQHHPYTDVSVLKQKYMFVCMNLPAGYYRWHCTDEYVQMSSVDKCIQIGVEIITALGSEIYTFNSKNAPEDDPKSPVKVTELKSHDFEGRPRAVASNEPIGATHRLPPVKIQTGPREPIWTEAPDEEPVSTMGDEPALPPAVIPPAPAPGPVSLRASLASRLKKQ